MYHYVALIWNPHDPRASRSAAELGCALEHAAPNWTATFASEGMRVYTESPRTADLRPYRLPESRGVILGRLFPAESSELAPGWKPVFTVRAATLYLETAGRQLTTDYWGAYVAFLTSPATGHGAVVRDPSGKIPCYTLRHAEVQILFSDLGDLAALPLPPFTLNLRYLAAFIYRDTLQIRESALAEVTEILAGECLEVRPASTQLHPASTELHLAWDPCAVASERHPRTYEQAAARLRFVTQACIDAWASVHGRVLHCLSGGLDSSIVLGCLSRTPSAPAVVCVNRFLEGEGDERAYARAAAERAKTPLIESRWTTETFAFDARLLDLPIAAKPSYPQCSRAIQLDVINREAARHRADAVWKGQGGDHLFLKSSEVPSLEDYVADRGVRWGLLSVARDAAALSAQPYASLLKSALLARRARRARSRRQALPCVGQEAHFVRVDALPEDLAHYLAHPWVLAAEGLPRGRQYQIYLLSDVVSRHRPLPRREFADEHHPLLSQPIVEHCLRTPTYVHLHGGRHRALARDAFRDDVPAQILHREDKGTTTTLVAETIRRCGAFLCELLLDGALVRERLVVRSELEACLRDGRALRPAQLPPLTACIAAEVWARRISRQRAYCPAFSSAGSSSP